MFFSVCFPIYISNRSSKYICTLEIAYSKHYKPLLSEVPITPAWRFSISDCGLKLFGFLGCSISCIPLPSAILEISVPPLPLNSVCGDWPAEKREGFGIATNVRWDIYVMLSHKLVQSV